MQNSKTLDEMQADIQVIISAISARSAALNNLTEGIKTPGEKREILDALLDFCGLEKNEESRYAAYIRIAKMWEDNLINYLGKTGFSKEAKENILKKAYSFVADYHGKLHENLLAEIEEKELLTPFYREVFRGAREVGITFNAFYRAWDSYLIRNINPDLEAQFWNQDAIMKYLTDNNLLDKGHSGEIADRSYSVLQETESGYEKLAYVRAFPEEIFAIISALENFISALEKHEDTIYHQKAEHISYLRALIVAFSEQNTDALVEKWANVDREWMKLTNPFQIVHPLEFYEDMYRKAVAPEWEFRTQDTTLFTSKVSKNIIPMFEKLCEKLEVSKDSKMREFSLGNIQKVQLHIASPVFYYGARFNGLPSAQIVPNDEVVSKLHGKKIFSFAADVLAWLRARPEMKLATLTLEENLRAKRKSVIFGEDLVFYRLYDIETLGHEFGHALWLEPDTESRMNATGNFKNIEEWKATMGGLIAFFLHPEEDMKEAVIVDMIIRCIRLIEQMKVDESRNYYIEWLIHLDSLFRSGMIFENTLGQVELQFTDDTFETLKNICHERYEKIALTYIHKEDASNFLFEYVIFEDGKFLPKDEKIRDFVKRYYGLYEKWGNVLEK